MRAAVAALALLVSFFVFSGCSTSCDVRYDALVLTGSHVLVFDRKNGETSWHAVPMPGERFVHRESN